MLGKRWPWRSHRSADASRSEYPTAGNAARRLTLESLESRIVLSGVPFGAMQQDTGGFLLGDVTTTVVLLESTGAASSEDWTVDSIAAVKANVEEALTWWQDTLADQQSVHSVQFLMDYQYTDNPVATALEPIAERSNLYTTWVNDFLDEAGSNTFDGISADMRKFNDAQRREHETNWGFTIFVVNDENDADGMFADGGSFRRGFAFSGGRYLVVPAGRPASSIAHEMGHIFWARDEYSGAGSYLQKRGYYDAQNLNAADNPQVGFSQQDSIMASGTLLANAYANHTSSDSSLKMMGWQDSDGDGVFDVLDVPHSFIGTGYIDQVGGDFHFSGTAEVGLLLNRNSSGFQSDMTINQINRIEYRIDQGTWITSLTPGGVTANVQFSFAVPVGGQQVEIRSSSFDAGTGLLVTESNRISFDLGDRNVVTDTGLAGFVWVDVDSDGVWDHDEAGLSDVAVRLVDGTNQQIQMGTQADPDGFLDSVVLNSRFASMTLTAVGTQVVNADVYSRVRNDTSTGTRVFANFSSATSSVMTTWGTSTRTLKVTFDAPVSEFSIDAVADTNGDVGRLEAYSSTGVLLDRVTTSVLADGEVETMLLERGVADIAYVIARAHYDTELHLDNIIVGPATAVTTDELGVFRLNSLPAGDYQIQMQGRSGWEATTPIQVGRTLSAGVAVADVRYGLAPPVWHHLDVPVDVDASGDVVPLDALLIVNDLNTRGARQLSDPTEGDAPPPYYDVSGDGWLTSLDALQVVNWLNANMSGESEAAIGRSMVNILTAPVNLLTASTSVDDEAVPQTVGQSPIEYDSMDDYYTQAADQVLTLWFNRNSLVRTELLDESNSDAVDDGLTIDIE
jgi:hypothetical protein